MCLHSSEGRGERYDSMSSRTGPFRPKNEEKKDLKDTANKRTRRSCTGQAQCEVSAYARSGVVVDAALRRIRKSRHGGHKFANISVNCQRI